MNVDIGGLSDATGEQRPHDTIPVLFDFLKQRSEGK